MRKFLIFISLMVGFMLANAASKLNSGLYFIKIDKGESFNFVKQ